MIDKFGVEIECLHPTVSYSRIDEVLSNELPELSSGWFATDDGSIGGNSPCDEYCDDCGCNCDCGDTCSHCSHECDCNGVEDGDYSCEIVSPPIKSLKMLKKDLNIINNRFKKLAINNNCGLHIHVSLKSKKDYNLLCDWKFCKFFTEKYINKYKNDVKAMSRLKNSYCESYADKYRFNLLAGRQCITRSKDGVRYKIINFNSYNHHGTIEFRIFKGTVDPKQIYEYTSFLLSCIREYFKLNKGYKRKGDINYRKECGIEEDDVKKELIQINEVVV